jgi:AcrR family transcriptional regulator
MNERSCFLAEIERSCYFLSDVSSITSESDGRRARGARTRAQILERAANLASVEGLEGLTIGRLAAELGMSKSGLFAHFGSKEELQLATIDAAREIFAREVVAPAREAERGLPRLEALLAAKLRYERGEIFDGGCFFETVRAEFDSRHPGPVRDAVEADLEEWDALMLRVIRSAIKAGHLKPDTDAAQLQYEIEALSMTASLRHQMTGDAALFARAETAIAARLDAARA